MGDYFQIIVDKDVSAEDAPKLAAHVREWLVARRIIKPGLSDCALGSPGHAPGVAQRTALEEPDADFWSGGVNGLVIDEKRNVFHAIDCILTCRACGASFDATGDWSDAVDDWYRGNDDAMFNCPECRMPERLTDWSGEIPWGFGNLGFTFWNWPPLSERFVREVTEKLGHRTVFVSGKL